MTHPTGCLLQHTASHCNTLQAEEDGRKTSDTSLHCNTLQHTATHCNSLHHTATRFRQRNMATKRRTLVCTATHCNKLQLTASHCNTLQAEKHGHKTSDTSLHCTWTPHCCFVEQRTNLMRRGPDPDSVDKSRLVCVYVCVCVCERERERACDP